jgi:glycosyltransferase involved in cell wall biosynthesis
MTAPQALVTAIIITFNEAVHLRRCIERLKPLADRIVVVDSFSTDGTVEIARSLGAELLQNPFVNHATQFNWGLDAAAVTEGWVLRIDADEWLEAEAIEELQRLLPTLGDEVAAVSLRRKVIFQGGWIRRGGYYPVILTRLWRAGRGRVEQRWMDEHVAITGGETKLLQRGDLVDENVKDLTDWTAKHNSYATRQMIEEINLQFPLFAGHEADNKLNAAATRKRFLRTRVYSKVPLYARALLYFIYRYILRLGFLDGSRGLVFHTLQGFWFFFLVDAKVDEARRFIAAHGLAEFRAHLARRHNILLEPPASG